MHSRRKWSRRIVMPLIILAAAGGLAVWGAGRKAQRTDEVRELVTGLVEDVARGRDPGPRLGGTDPLVAGPLIRRLERVCAEGAADLAFEVRRGDTTELGNLPQEATHTAILRRNDVKVLGLRLVHRGPQLGIVVVGFWEPQE